MSFHHTKCKGEIIRRDPSPDAITRVLRERTHWCNCSNWKIQPNGYYKVFRYGFWEELESGEVMEVQRRKK